MNYARRVWNSEIPGNDQRLNELSIYHISYAIFAVVSVCEATSWRRKSLRPEGHREVAVGSLFLYGRLARKTLGLAPYDTDDLQKSEKVGFWGGSIFQNFGDPFFA